MSRTRSRGSMTMTCPPPTPSRTGWLQRRRPAARCDCAVTTVTGNRSASPPTSFCLTNTPPRRSSPCRNLFLRRCPIYISFEQRRPSLFAWALGCPRHRQSLYEVIGRPMTRPISQDDPGPHHSRRAVRRAQLTSAHTVPLPRNPRKSQEEFLNLQRVGPVSVSLRTRI